MSHTRYMKKRFPYLLVLLFVAYQSFGLTANVKASSGDVEYLGKLESQLVPYTEDLDQIVFKPLRDLSKIKFATPIESDVKVTAGRLYHPVQDKSSILTLLVEPNDDSAPYIYADLNLDGVMGNDERFPLERGEDDNTYILGATLNIPINST